MNYFYKKMPSPLGELTLVAKENHLIAVLWQNDDKQRVRLPKLQMNENHSILCETEKQLNEYFVRKRKTFDLPLNFIGTEFQKRVWKGLQNIPYSKTTSYGNLARQLGMPKSSRAVGAANHRNPLSIVIPCHRVIGANGKLVGYAGGLDSKLYLLKFEKNE